MYCTARRTTPPAAAEVGTIASGSMCTGNTWKAAAATWRNTSARTRSFPKARSSLVTACACPMTLAQ